MTGCAGDEDDDKAPSAQETQDSRRPTPPPPPRSTTWSGPISTSTSAAGRSTCAAGASRSTASRPSSSSPGRARPLSYWDYMAAQFALDGHHLCAYDRAGVGGSEVPPEDRRTTKDQVADLVALLDGTDLNEPLVLVAHSLGSLPAIGLAEPGTGAGRRRGLHRPVDTTLEDCPARGAAAGEAERVGRADGGAAVPDRVPHRPDPEQRAPPRRRVRPGSDRAARQTRTALRRPAGRRAPGSSPAAPGGLPRSYAAVAAGSRTNGNKELAAESADGSVIEVEDTGHNIHEDQPEVVMDAILDVLAG